MIIDNPGSWYIFLFSGYFDDSDDPAPYLAYRNKRLTNREYLKHWGKWIFFGERKELDEIAHKLDPYVEDGAIPCIKYDRRPQTWFDLDNCVMCVYCDDRQREEVWQILSKFGVKTKAWVYEKEVIENWLPGGLFMEKWIKFHGVKEEQAVKIREDSRRRYSQFFNRPDDICLPWAQ